MADKHGASRRNTSEKQSASRRNDVVRCERCGEDYSITYKRCPFCDERPGRGNYISGKRVAGGGQYSGYNGPVNPIQIVGLIISLILIITALFIVFTKLIPLFTQDSGLPGGSASASVSQSGGQDASQSGAASGGSSSEQPGGSAGSSTQAEPVLVQAISLSREDFTLSSGEVYELIAAVAPEGVTEPVVWSSSDVTVATVDEYGTVTNVNMGTTKESVTITASCGGKSATCIVRCNPSGSAAGGNSGGTTGGSTGGTTASVAPNTPGTIVNAGSGLNIRSGPGSQHEVVASAANGAKITILEDSGSGWYKIDYGNGKIGYVSSDYVSVGS